MGAKVTFLTRQLDEAAQKAPPTRQSLPTQVVNRGETKPFSWCRRTKP